MKSSLNQKIKCPVSKWNLLKHLELQLALLNLNQERIRIQIKGIYMGAVHILLETRYNNYFKRVIRKLIMEKNKLQFKVLIKVQKGNLNKKTKKVTLMDKVMGRAKGPHKKLEEESYKVSDWEEWRN